MSDQPSTSSAASIEGPNAAERSVKIFNFEKQRRRERPVRHQPPENLLRRAGGLKQCGDLKYEQLLPLYQLWKSYYKQLMAAGKPDERLLKADYHFAMFQVAHAPNPAQVGLYGIVLHESRSTFQMLTKRNRVIVIPKEGATFQFVLDAKLFTLFGDALRQRSHLRGRKAKVPSRIPYFLN